MSLRHVAALLATVVSYAASADEGGVSFWLPVPYVKWRARRHARGGVR